MFRIALIAFVLCSGCSNIGIDAWSFARASCPDDDYDTGGSRANLMIGYCKIGKGGMISYTRNF